MKPEDKILNVGAGNSKLSEEMYEEGYHNIVNIDISGQFYYEKFIFTVLGLRCCREADGRAVSGQAWHGLSAGRLQVESS